MAKTLYETGRQQFQVPPQIKENRDFNLILANWLFSYKTGLRKIKLLV